MTKTELVDIVTAVVMAYPERYKEESIPGLVTAWYAFFKDDDARIVELAVTKHISVNKWTPNIAEIREQMISIIRPDIIPPDVAWSMVCDVLYTESEYGHFDLYSTFPEPIARVVETIGWSKLYNLHCNRYGRNADGMDRVAFMDLYKPAYEREREKAMLPEQIRQVCEKIQHEIGGETMKMIEDAQDKRREREEYYADSFTRNYKKLIEHNEKKLLGGNSDEE